MKNLNLSIITTSLLILAFSNFSCTQERPKDAISKSSIYNYSFKSIDGKKIKLSEFNGKNILIVNVASKCGFTPQYEDLEKLNREYGGKLVIIGFPANNFNEQEPGTNEEITEFCKTNYDVTFTLSEKISVVGSDRHEIYKWLTDKKLNGWNDTAPKWNFYKYLINENGELTNVFPSTTNPMNKEIIDAIIE